MTIAWLVRGATVEDIADLMALRLSVHENRLSDPSQLTAENCLRYVRRGHMWVWNEDQEILGSSAVTCETDGSGPCSCARHERRGIGRVLSRLPARLWPEPDSAPCTSAPILTPPRRASIARPAGEAGRTPEGELIFEFTVPPASHIRLEFSTIQRG